MALALQMCIVFGLIDLSIDTFQKAYHLSNVENLLLSLTYDISSCLIVVFISYYGGKGNIPRWITFSSFLVGFGSLLFAFPYFSDGNYQSSINIEDICQEMKTSKICKKSSSFSTKYIASFILGQTVQGIAGMPLYVLGVVFIGNSVATHSAGCTQSKTFNYHKAYYNCSCIQEGLTTSDDQGDFIDARPGTCDTKCYKLPLFVAFIFSTILFSIFSRIPSTLTILRIVPDNQRYLALGLTYVILRIFGTIPGPILFRMAGDTSCIFRVTEYCGNKGNCWIYNKLKMAYLMVGICSICKLITIFFTAIAFCLYKCLSEENSDTLHIPVKNLKVKRKGKN